MKINHVKCYKKEYPRPQFVRESWMNLNGEWDFVFDDENIGETKEYFREFPGNAIKIKVPFCYLCKDSGIGSAVRHDNVWYAKKIDIDESLIGCKVNLTFEGSDFVTKVWVNGTYVGIHTGGYSRFAFDIADLLSVGDNLVVVKVEDNNDMDRARGKQRVLDHNYGCWYEETTGIYKTVWLDISSKEAFRSVEINPIYDSQSVEFVFDVPCWKNKVAEAEVRLHGKLVASGSICLKGNYERLEMALFSGLDEWETTAWDTYHPALYDVKFTLSDLNDGILDEVGSYFGFRQVRILGDRILLNNDPIYLKMVLDQGYWSSSHLTPPDEDAILKDVLLIREAGFNGVRKHQKIEDERFYYYCDVLGLLVWCEMPSCYRFTDHAVESTIQSWQEIVKQMRNHPSIITWVPFNESWGVKNIQGSEFQQNYTRSVYYLTKTLDRQKRPVISNDGWEHTISDIVTLHNYDQYGQELLAAYADKEKAMKEMQVAGGSIRTVFAKGNHYEGQPVIVSEYGGIALQDGASDAWGYGEKANGQESYLMRLDGLTSAIKTMNYMCGYCLTQFTDVMQEKNGLFDMERNEKVPVAKIKEINDRQIF